MTFTDARYVKSNLTKASNRLRVESSRVAVMEDVIGSYGTSIVPEWLNLALQDSRSEVSLYTRRIEECRAWLNSRNLPFET